MLSFFVGSLLSTIALGFLQLAKGRCSLLAGLIIHGWLACAASTGVAGEFVLGWHGTHDFGVDSGTHFGMDLGFDSGANLAGSFVCQAETNGKSSSICLLARCVLVCWCYQNELCCC